MSFDPAEIARKIRAMNDPQPEADTRPDTQPDTRPDTGVYLDSDGNLTGSMPDTVAKQPDDVPDTCEDTQEDRDVDAMQEFVLKCRAKNRGFRECRTVKGKQGRYGRYNCFEIREPGRRKGEVIAEVTTFRGPAIIAFLPELIDFLRKEGE